LRSILIGMLASFFFAFTFILNRSMELGGGSWVWSASLRYIFMVPFLVLIVGLRRNLRPLMQELWNRPWIWIGWSFVGFFLFYAPLTFAASFGPAWLIAGTWPVTIIAGSLLVPLFYDVINTPNGSLKVRKKIPYKALWMSFIILIGIALLQVQQANSLSIGLLFMSIIPVIIAAFAYPLGNRKMMAACDGRLDTFQRVLGMTLASMPFWMVLSFYGLMTQGLPSIEQTIQSLMVALFSGVIATVLFFWATDMVKDSPQMLAAVEATQSGSVVFAVIGEVLLLSGSLPTNLSFVGLGIIVGGMVLHSFFTRKTASSSPGKTTGLTT
jgi:drug/metabolite transporter (DMT)-like permease